MKSVNHFLPTSTHSLSHIRKHTKLPSKLWMPQRDRKSVKSSRKLFWCWASSPSSCGQNCHIKRKFLMICKQAWLASSGFMSLHYLVLHLLLLTVVRSRQTQTMRLFKRSILCAETFKQNWWSWWGRRDGNKAQKWVSFMCFQVAQLINTKKSCTEFDKWVILRQLTWNRKSCDFR